MQIPHHNLTTYWRARQEDEEAALQLLGLLPTADLLGLGHRVESHLRRVLAQIPSRPHPPALRPARRLHGRVPAAASARARRPAQPRTAAAIEPQEPRNLQLTHAFPCSRTQVPWTGGVIGGTVDMSIRWTTGPEGMRSSSGEELTNWRAWEPAGAYEKRLKRGREGGKRHG